MRCWRWHERPRVSTLCVAFAAAVISAGAGSLPGAHGLPAAVSARMPLSFPGIRIRHLRLERFGAHLFKTPAVKSAARLHDGGLLNLALLRQAKESLVANLLTL